MITTQTQKGDVIKLEREQRGWFQRAIIALEIIADSITIASQKYYNEEFLAGGGHNNFTLTGTPATGTAEENFIVVADNIVKGKSDITYAAGVVTILGAVIAAGKKVLIWYPK